MREEGRATLLPTVRAREPAVNAANAYNNTKLSYSNPLTYNPYFKGL